MNKLFLLIVTGFVFISCSKDEQNTAGGSDSETMFQAEIFNSNGVASPNTVFRMIPEDYKPYDESSPLPIIQYTSDSSGIVEFNTQDIDFNNSYNLLILDSLNHESYFLADFTPNKLLQVYLESSREIAVRLNYGLPYGQSDSAWVYFPGTNIGKICLGDYKTIANIPPNLTTIKVFNDSLDQSFELDAGANKLKLTISPMGLTYP